MTLTMPSTLQYFLNSTSAARPRPSKTMRHYASACCRGLQPTARRRPEVRRSTRKRAPRDCRICHQIRRNSIIDDPPGCILKIWTRDLRSAISARFPAQKKRLNCRSPTSGHRSRLQPPGRRVAQIAATKASSWWPPPNGNLDGYRTTCGQLRLLKQRPCDSRWSQQDRRDCCRKATLIFAHTNVKRSLARYITPRRRGHGDATTFDRAALVRRMRRGAESAAGFDHDLQFHGRQRRGVSHAFNDRRWRGALRGS
jgi:hypothetical protein